MPVRWRIACIALVIQFAGAAAAAQDDPDWPCVQRKIAELSWGQMWSGPPLPEDARWQDDPVLAQMVPQIAARRTGDDEVVALVAGLRAGDGETRNQRLTRLFAGVFEQINHQRSRLMEGIVRYARKQEGLSEQIDTERAEIDRLKATTAETDYDGLDRIEEMEDRLAWDTRIYKDRRQSLTYVCESPVLLEKRAFAVAHVIQAALE